LHEAVWLCARAAYIRSRSGLMIRSDLATMYQLGLSFQAGLLIGVLNTFAAVKPCERASNVASSPRRSAAKSA